VRRRAFAAAAASVFVQRALPAAARAGRWSSAADLPEPRQAFAIASAAGAIFVLGGYSARGQQLNQMYDPALDRWFERAPLPAALNYPEAAAVDGQVYVIGGFAESFGIIPGRAQGGGYRYDPKSDTWARIDVMPTWRAGFALIERDGALFAVGGRARLDFNVNERYDPRSDSWESRAPLPTPREQLAGGVLRGLIHVTGGREFQLGRNSARHDIYDPGEDVWREGPPLPRTRSAHAAAILDGSLVLVGGEDNESLDADVIAFDPDRGYWQDLPTLPHPRQSLGAAVVNGTLYAIGGGAAHGLAAPTALNETFN
jgi:N-acetylneuraminic acid mutarotase